MQILHLHSWWSLPATGTGGGFSMPISSSTDVHKHIRMGRTLQLALCGGGWDGGGSVVYKVFIYIHTIPS